MLLWLELDDLNTLSNCSKRLRDARRHPSLDQTHIGTIIFHPESTTTCSTLYDRIVKEEWNKAFQSSRNQTHLRIVNLDNLKRSTIGQLRNQIKKEKIRLTGVTHLDLSGDYADYDYSRRNFYNGVVVDKGRYSIFPRRVHHKALSLLMPNLVCLDLSYTCTGHHLEDWARNCPSLQSITWAGNGNLYIDGGSFQAFPNLRVLNLPLTHFYTPYINGVIPSSTPFGCCRILEQLDIRGATWMNYPEKHSRPISVDAITKLLKNSTTIEWLACDLSPADKNDLEKKFPHVTFLA